MIKVKKKKRSGVITSLLSGIILFVTIALVVTIAVVVYDRIYHFDDKFWPIVGVIIALAIFGALIDNIRRKYMVDKPTQEILDATDEIACGNFDVKLELGSSYTHYTEYDYIKENINRMSVALSKNEMLHNDFISNVSHELKTPLAVIQNYAQALNNDNLSDQERKVYLDTLVDTSKKLSDLVGNILKLNKLENSGTPPQYDKVSLDDLLSNCLIQYEDAIDKKGITLNCDIDEMQIVSAAEYIEIVFNNLISNAVKFTQDSGNIDVSLKNVDGVAVIKVQDNGCGISSESGARIFEKFYQCDKSHTLEGNGLGLALVKKVIDVIGGEITVESEIGKGSVFILKLKDNN